VTRPGSFGIWLLFFYSVWFAIVVLVTDGRTVISHWPIAAAMAGGSIVAGSSPVAGGAIGFPVLVFVFDHPANLSDRVDSARDSLVRHF